jgi:hypothetical protein
MASRRQTKPAGATAATRIRARSPGDADRVIFRLAGDLGRPIEWRPDPSAFQAAAMRWSNVARNRERWRAAGKDPAQADDGPLAGQLAAPELERLARAEVVEVSLPESGAEHEGWAFRVFPWEYALTAVTRTLRSGPMVVVRQLRRAGAPADAAVAIERAATVECAPGRLAQCYDTRLEGDRMLRSLGFDPAQVKDRLRDPSLGELHDWMRSTRPGLLHLAGVDNHQAVDLLGAEREFPARERRDGFALKSADPARSVHLADAESLAGALCSEGRGPDLVMCNFYNSGARVAARIVARGAKAAVGYHDVIDDSLAELFCTSLYGALADGQGLLESFRRALVNLRQQGTLRGAGVVLWSAVSLLQAPRAAPTRTTRLSELRPADQVPPRERITVRATHRPLINYSLLHNGQSPLASLLIERTRVEGPVRDIQVRVELDVGGTTCPYQSTFELPAERQALVLTDEVVLPLTSTLIRTQSERIQSSLRLSVHCAGERVAEQTFRVGLAPVDEWQDGDHAEWRWLPSFVLPRDPAVARIVDSAHAILCALSDDPAAGFDGYQSVDERGADDDARYGSVDRQVRALWYAVLDHHGLTYINPPPSYGQATQRLRTPSQLLAERRGTCIDLALLLAACLEYVGISPVLFLLSGHAFAGYWRSEALYARFRTLQAGRGDAMAADRPDTGPRSTLANPKGVIGQGQQREVQQHIALGHLVPLETTWLTARGSFDAAVEEGRHNVRSADYQALIDVRLSRDLGITPLPLLGAAS